MRVLFQFQSIELETGMRLPQLLPRWLLVLIKVLQLMLLFRQVQQIVLQPVKPLKKPATFLFLQQR